MADRVEIPTIALSQVRAPGLPGQPRQVVTVHRGYNSPSGSAAHAAVLCSSASTHDPKPRLL